MNLLPLVNVEQVTMLPASTRFIVFVNALLLVLPPGWCQVVSAQCRSDKASTPTTCCDETPQTPAPASKSAPVSPELKCCCNRDVLPPDKSAQQTGDLSVALFVIPSDLTAISCPQSISNTTFADLHAGPKLQILQCQWRC